MPIEFVSIDGDGDAVRVNFYASSIVIGTYNRDNSGPSASLPKWAVEQLRDQLNEWLEEQA